MSPSLPQQPRDPAARAPDITPPASSTFDPFSPPVILPPLYDSLNHSYGDTFSATYNPPFGGHGAATLISLWKYPSSGSTEFHETPLRDVQDERILRVPPRSPNGEDPEAGLRLVVVEVLHTMVRNQQVTPEARRVEEMRVGMKALFEAFDVPLGTYGGMARGCPQYATLDFGRRRGWISFGDWSIGWSSDHAHGRTDAVLCHWHNFNASEAPLNLVYQLKKLKDLICHDMFLKLVTGIAALSPIPTELWHQRWIFLQTENDSEIMEDFVTFLRNDKRYQKVSTVDLGRLSGRTTGQIYRLNRVKQHLLTIQDLIDSFKTEKAITPSREIINEASEQSDERLFERTELYLNQLVKGLMIQADTLHRDNTTQLSMLTTKSVERDQKISIEIAKSSQTIAWESKRDSSSMKTLAGVTMFYLPATFVASLFAMPLFRWEAPSDGNTMSGQMWIYWVVAVVLTILTYLVFLTWYYWRIDRKPISLDGNAQNEVHPGKEK